MITILGKEFPIYGILCMVGIVAAAFTAFYLAKRRNSTKMDFFEFVSFGIYILVGALVGAKLLFIVVTLDPIIVTIKKIGWSMKLVQDLLFGGWVFYGGFIGGALGVILYVKLHKKSLKDYLDFCAVVIPLGHAFGRIGCFKGGCCYGMQLSHDAWYAYTYTECLNPLTPLGVPLLPIQLIEATCLFVLFGVLLFLFFKMEKEFDCWLVYLGVYGVIRFVLEFFRGDAERGGFLISTSQWISLGLIGIAVGVWIYKLVKGKYVPQIAMVEESEIQPVEVVPSETEENDEKPIEE